MSLLSPTKNHIGKGQGAWLLVLLLFIAFSLPAFAQPPVDTTQTNKSLADTSQKKNLNNLNTLKGAKGGITIDSSKIVEPVIVKGKDTLKLKNIPTIKDTAALKHSPRKATIMSALLPGLGQIYNHHWWKVPIIYGGLAGVGYAIGFNQKYYHDFREALKLRLDGNPNTIDAYEGKYSNANLDELQQYYRKNRDLSIIIAVGVYALNILDANVDAHLFDFDVSSDLSMRISPTSMPAFGRPTPGLSVALKFKK